MAWATPQYSKSQIDAAGSILVADDFPRVDATGEVIGDHSLVLQIEQAFAIINNWRSSHSFPLNTLQIGLRRLSKQVDPNSLVAQRIKRLSSIELKLRRFSTMKLSQMQDIGGCRAVVRSVRDVDALVIVSLYRGSNIKHKLDHVDDYIRKPQRSGYRG